MKAQWLHGIRPRCIGHRAGRQLGYAAWSLRSRSGSHYGGAQYALVSDVRVYNKEAVGGQVGRQDSLVLIVDFSPPYYKKELDYTMALEDEDETEVV